MPHRQFVDRRDREKWVELFKRWQKVRERMFRRFADKAVEHPGYQDMRWWECRRCGWDPRGPAWAWFVELHIGARMELMTLSAKLDRRLERI
jgi:hypothetical protein